MEKAYLDCTFREEIRKKLGALRRGGFVPAVVYGKKDKTLSIKLERSHLIKFIHSHHGIENMVITLRIQDDEKAKKSKEEKSVLIKDIQYDPVRDDILHIDFNQISLTETLKVKVPIASKGEAEGVKKEGGVLTHVLWELEVECLPTEIPEKLEVDISPMKIGDTIFVKDIKIPEGIKVLADREAIVFTLLAPKKEEVVVEAPVEGAPAEPEVIKEKKEKAEEETEEAKKEKPEAKKEKTEAKKEEKPSPKT